MQALFSTIMAGIAQLVHSMLHSMLHMLVEMGREGIMHGVADRTRQNRLVYIIFSPAEFLSYAVGKSFPSAMACPSVPSASIIWGC